MGNPGKMPELQPWVGCSGPPPFNPDPSGSGSMLQGPPGMANGSKVPKHMGVSPDAETPAISPYANGIAGIPDLSSGGNSSQPCPIQPLSSPPQLLQHNIIGCQYYSCLVERIQTNLFQQEKKSYDMWFEPKQKRSLGK